MNEVDWSLISHLATKPHKHFNISPDCEFTCVKHGDDHWIRFDSHGVYDCCPHPHIECWSERNAGEVAAALTHVDADVCP